jgi:N-acetylglucosaminyldiphosphoundecaprenol N-acetyl-beta-D-mannosaminyltransferase
MSEKIFLAGVKVDVITGNSILDKLDSAVKENSTGTFLYINAHGVNLSQKHSWFKQFLNQSTVTYADGQGIRLASWLLGLPIPPLVNLTRWAWELLPYCEKKKYSIFILGATETNISRAVENIKRSMPNLNIVGFSHGYFEKQGSESDAIVEKINLLSPNVLIVGMGMTLQEKWILENINKLKVNAIFSAGSCLDYLAGAKKVCPKWLSNIGMEWLFRLIHEPNRLFVRYIIGNPRFLYYIFTRKNEKE